MASAKEIKNRIKSIKDTQKITNAMYLIASTKMRKAKEELDKTRPYFAYLQSEIKRVFRTFEDVENKYMYPVKKDVVLDGKFVCLVITADKGLAGAYNLNVIKEAEKMLEEHPDTELFVVGEYGRQYFMQHHIPIKQNFLYTAQNPTLRQAREITSVLLEIFDTQKVDKVFLIYTDLKNGLNAEVKTTRMLPFHRQHFYTDRGDDVDEIHYDFYPSPSAVLDTLIPSYVTGFVYSALVDGFCCEQNARMVAMDSANQNADSILGELSIQYNRMRQAAITQEITEVSAGAKAQKRKRLKKRQREVKVV